jgi:hypothetical protein
MVGTSRDDITIHVEQLAVTYLVSDGRNSKGSDVCVMTSDVPIWGSMH